MPSEYSDFECLSNSNGELVESRRRWRPRFRYPVSYSDAFKQLQLANALVEAEQKRVQHQINERVAHIIRLTREVANMTNCKHDKVETEIKNVYEPRRMRRCYWCRAWLE